MNAELETIKISYFLFLLNNLYNSAFIRFKIHLNLIEPYFDVFKNKRGDLKNRILIPLKKSKVQNHKFLFLFLFSNLQNGIILVTNVIYDCNKPARQ